MIVEKISERLAKVLLIQRLKVFKWVLNQHPLTFVLDALATLTLWFTKITARKHEPMIQGNYNCTSQMLGGFTWYSCEHHCQSHDPVVLSSSVCVCVCLVFSGHLFCVTPTWSEIIFTSFAWNKVLAVEMGFTRA